MGDEWVTNKPKEGHYIGFNMWVNAVEAAGSPEEDTVRAKMYCQTFPNLTVGVAEMLPNHHLSRPVLIGEIQADGQFDIISQTKRFRAVRGQITCPSPPFWCLSGQA